MTSPTLSTDNNPFPTNFDLSQIFIGREQQLDLFQLYLDRWKRLIATPTVASDTQVTTAPSPNDKIQGLVVLLYGRGGFGKSTLLKRYREIALEPDRKFTVSRIVDWEFAVEGKRSLFNPAPGREVDAPEYFRVLCGQLAMALGKRTDDFKEYQKAVEAVDDARKQARRVLDGIQKDDRYASLRWLAGEGAVELIRWIAPRASHVLDNEKVAEKVKEVVGKGAEIGAEQLVHLHAKLQDKLGDYLEPALRLGLALGRDLCQFARNFPLLIFFDTYEEIDEGDRLLRMVMGAAGVRVGWVIAGRDNLWAGLEQIKRRPDVEYGYKEIVPPDRGLPVDFNVGGVGTFTPSDIVEYFAQLRERVLYEPSLPLVTPEDAARILEVTQGVPLAVKIAAGLYLEKADLEIITEKTDGKRTIVDQMVRRYLLHTRADQGESARLYGLALLRRADHPIAVASALGFTPEQARTGYETELSRLQRRYSFIFTEKEQPSLHQEVRHFLRLWLLEHRDQPEIVTVNEQLKKAHEAVLKDLEARRQYGSLRERLEDEEWVGIYLDLTEQLFWFDPAEGVRYCLPFMLAAAIYLRDINQDAADIGEFFETILKQPYRNWWKWAAQSLIYHNWWEWAAQSLIYNTSRDPSDQELTKLEELLKLVSQRRLTFPSVVLQGDYQQELEAALWWRLGEAHQGRDDSKALEWYEKALTRLGEQVELREAAAKVCWNVAYKLYQEKRYTERLPFLNRAIELKHDYAVAYNSRGNTYYDLKEYQQAITDYDQTIQLDPSYAIAYNNRGLAYAKLKEYQRAITDFDQAIQLDPSYALAYNNRGIAYKNIKEYQKAISDYDRAIQLDPSDAAAYASRGESYRLLEEYQRAIEDFDHAIELDSKFAWAYGSRGQARLWTKNIKEASNDYSRSYELDPTDINAAWMFEWIGMGKERAGIEIAERLETVAGIDEQNYLAHVCRGVALGLRGKLKESLVELDLAIEQEPEEWDPYFWKGMVCAYLGRNQAAVEAVEKALEVDLPPVLLTPLYWMEKDRPDFFWEYAEPLLVRYGI